MSLEKAPQEVNLLRQKYVAYSANQLWRNYVLWEVFPDFLTLGKSG
jgi:hypothetical protein